MGYGKWIGGVLGWAVLGPLGAIIGYYIGSALEDDSRSKSGTDPRYDQGQRNSFLISLLVLSAAVIKADGKVTSAEIAKLREFFARNFGTQAANEAEKIVKEIVHKDFNIYEVCGQVRSCMDYSQRMQLYHYLVSLGACDGLMQCEVDILEVIATNIGLSKGDADSILALFRPSNDANYRILGISPEATDEEVKKAYNERSGNTF